MHILQMFMQFVRTQDSRAYLRAMVSCFAAPVVGGIKCGSLLNLTRGGEDLRGAWYSVREDLARDLAVDFAEISVSERSILLLVYKRELLTAILREPETKAFLQEIGYACDETALHPYIELLCRRFVDGVPHEIGLFLGYPLTDVRGFIDNGGRNAKFSGYWKVYGDEVGALRKFDEYKKAESDSAWLLLEKAGLAPNVA